jgi:hypothetical protein
MAPKPVHYAAHLTVSRKIPNVSEFSEIRTGAMGRFLGGPQWEPLSEAKYARERFANVLFGDEP